MLRERGYEVTTVDIDPTFNPDIRVDVLLWDYKAAFPPLYFDVMACGPPCTEFSIAKTVGQRDFPYADSLVQKALEIVNYFQPSFWFLENPRTGYLKSRPYMKGLPYVDADYCCFSDWGVYKPTRFWGSPCLGLLPNVECDKKTCPNMEKCPDRVCGHRHMLGRTPVAGRRKLSAKEQYPIPRDLIAYLMSSFEPPPADRGSPSGQDTAYKKQATSVPSSQPICLSHELEVQHWRMHHPLGRREWLLFMWTIGPLSFVTKKVRWQSPQFIVQ